MVDAVIVDGELHPHGVGGDRVRVHALQIGAGRLRQVGLLRVLVHAARLIGQRAAGVRQHDLQLGVALHEAREDEPRGRDADLDDATEAQMQGAVVAFERVHEDRVGRMQEHGQSERLDAGVERLEPLRVDARVVADAAGDVDAHEPQAADGILQDLDRDTCVGERDGGAGPDSVRILALRSRHVLVPLDRGVAALVGRQVREVDRERADRADDRDLVAEGVHVGELLVEVIPLGPAAQRRLLAALAQVSIAAAVVDDGARESLAAAKALEDRAGPPVEMGVDDSHPASPT